MSPGQKAMIENNLGIIRKVVLKFVRNFTAIDDSWQFAVACCAVCEAIDKWSPERGKFSTFISVVAHNAIVTEWNKQRKQIQFEQLESDDDFPIPTDGRQTLDVPYEKVFQNGFPDDLKDHVEMFRRSVEGENITEIVKEYGISRQSYYNRIKPIKKALEKHVISINE